MTGLPAGAQCSATPRRDLDARHARRPCCRAPTDGRRQLPPVNNAPCAVQRYANAGRAPGPALLPAGPSGHLAGRGQLPVNGQPDGNRGYASGGPGHHHARPPEQQHQLGGGLTIKSRYLDAPTPPCWPHAGAPNVPECPEQVPAHERRRPSSLTGRRWAPGAPPTPSAVPTSAGDAICAGWRRSHAELQPSACGASRAEDEHGSSELRVWTRPARLRSRKSHQCRRLFHLPPPGQQPARGQQPQCRHERDSTGRGRPGRCRPALCSAQGPPSRRRTSVAADHGQALAGLVPSAQAGTGHHWHPGGRQTQAESGRAAVELATQRTARRQRAGAGECGRYVAPPAASTERSPTGRVGRPPRMEAWPIRDAAGGVLSALDAVRKNNGSSRHPDMRATIRPDGGMPSVTGRCRGRGAAASLVPLQRRASKPGRRKPAIHPGRNAATVRSTGPAPSQFHRRSPACGQNARQHSCAPEARGTAPAGASEAEARWRRGGLRWSQMVRWSLGKSADGAATAALPSPAHGLPASTAVATHEHALAWWSAHKNMEAGQ